MTQNKDDGSGTSLPTSTGEGIKIVSFFETLRNFRTIGLIFVTLGAYIPFVYLHNRIDLTTKKIIRKKGTFFTKGEEISADYAKITDVKTIQAKFLGFATGHGFGGVFGWGTVELETAGSERLAAEIKEISVQSPQAFKYIMNDLGDNQILDSKGKEAVFYRDIWMFRQRLSSPFTYTTGYGWVYIPVTLVLILLTHASATVLLAVVIFWLVNFGLLLIIRR